MEEIHTLEDPRTASLNVFCCNDFRSHQEGMHKKRNRKSPFESISISMTTHSATYSRILPVWKDTAQGSTFCREKAVVGCNLHSTNTAIELTSSHSIRGSHTTTVFGLCQTAQQTTSCFLVFARPNFRRNESALFFEFICVVPGAIVLWTILSYRRDRAKVLHRRGARRNSSRW